MDWPHFGNKDLYKLSGQAKWNAQKMLRQQALLWFKSYIIGQTLTAELKMKLNQIYDGKLIFITNKNEQEEGNLSLISILYDLHSHIIIDVL